VVLKATQEALDRRDSQVQTGSLARKAILEQEIQEQLGPKALLDLRVIPEPKV